MNSYEAYNLISEIGVNNIDLEKIISESSAFSYLYAKQILKGRFELGEEAISKNIYYSFYYSVRVLANRFKLGEAVISQNPYYSHNYVFYVLKCKFELGETAISQDSNYSYEYSKIIQKRFKLGEKVMFTCRDYSHITYCNIMGYDHE